MLGKGKWGFLLVMTGVGLPGEVPTFSCMGLSWLPLPWVLQAETPIPRGLEAPAGGVGWGFLGLAAAQV